MVPLTQREQQYFHLRSLDNRMGHPDLISLFDLLDRWRHLPSYRLEPRADAFFALFLVDVLDSHLQSRGIRVDPRVIPEFPLGQRGTKRSDKADYFAVSTDRKYAFLIELKTDMRSLKVDQGHYLNRARDRGLAALLCDIRSMAKAKRLYARRKYFHLLKAIAALDLMKLPSDLEYKIYSQPRGVYDCIAKIDIPKRLPAIEIIYVVPKVKEGKNCIDFEAFAGVIENRGEIGKRLAVSLREWACAEAGEKRRGRKPCFKDG